MVVITWSVPLGLSASALMLEHRGDREEKG
jgi:hypothetical protein